MEPIHVIGIGLCRQDLTQTHLELIGQAQVLVGGQRHLDLFAGHSAHCILIKRDIGQVIREVKDLFTTKRIVVLASGDPLFHGIGSALLNHFDRNQIVIHPNISSISAAFAAIKVPWHDAHLVSLHAKGRVDFSFSNLNFKSKVAFLTSPGKGPEFIAGQLIQHNVTGFQICVLENLGDTDRQSIRWFDDYAQVTAQKFSHPNIVILIKSQGISSKENEAANVSHETTFGMDDHLFSHTKGLITKSEIRAVCLAKLCLNRKDHTLWDVGAGSGSVSIEASAMIPRGKVVALEKNPNRISDINNNITRFNCANISVHNLKFPEQAQELPCPDRIFIGGGGRDLGNILNASCEHLQDGGIIVVSTVLVQNTNMALATLKTRGFHPSMVQILISRSKAMPFGDRLEALNPVWLIQGKKPKPAQAQEQ